MRIADSLLRVRRVLRARLTGAAVDHQTQWLVSEGGWKLHARLHHPRRVPHPLPAVLLVPGLGGLAADFERTDRPVQVDEIVRLGCIVLALDLAGRGRSWGTESYGGPENHADVRAALAHLAGRPDVDPTRIGVISFSLGASAVAGALAGQRTPAAWWIDWEGPSDREIITAGGRRLEPADGHPLDDDRYWWPREPVRAVGAVGVPYLRYQSVVDHAQPGELRHAQRMIRAAAQGNLPWFQLNDHPQNDDPGAAATWAPAGVEPARDWLLGRIRTLHRLL